MYKFYKWLERSNKWKYTETFNSTLDPNYHSYINWCKENNMKWKLTLTSTGETKFEG